MTADACLIFHDNTLYLIAGATAKYLYAHDPSKVGSFPKSTYRVFESVKDNAARE